MKPNISVVDASGFDALYPTYQLPLLTRNVKHFNRIPGLKLLPMD